MSRRAKQQQSQPQPTRQPRWQFVLLAGWPIAFVAAGLLCFRGGVGSEIHAQGPPAGAASTLEPPAPSPEYTKRVVAYVNENQAITREDLGEYLIARQGAEKLELLVNKFIIDQACKERNISISELEIEHALNEDLSSLQVSAKEFTEKILKSYKKNIFEWKEDVIRPKLQLTALVRDHVTYTEQDVRDAFEAYYGEKIDCRIILYPKNEEARATSEYPNLRDSEAQFAQKAQSQASAKLAARGGKLDQPLGRHTAGCEALEKAAFSLQPGGISSVIGVPEGFVVIKCDARIPPDTTVNFDAVKDKLIKEVIAKRIQVEIPKAFLALREKANPRLLLEGANKKYNPTEEMKRTFPAHRGTNQMNITTPSN
jgi:parvulin-like peptidyl-prolyl isomerase